MNNKYAPHVKAFAFFCLLTVFSLSVSAQVGIGTTSPNGGAILDMESANKGVLIPRVNIASLNTLAPVTGGQAEGMLVYNTNTSTGPGFFYWNSNTTTGNWIPITPAAVDAWELGGNGGTTPGIGPGQHYMGTSNSQNLIIGTNGAERIRIRGNNGNVGIGNTGNPTQRLQVNGNIRLDGAFMPNNDAGTTDKILLSQGSGSAPIWGPGFLNTTEIENIGKYFTGPFSVPNGTFLTLTVADPNMTTDTVVSCNYVGPLPAPTGNLTYGYNFTLFASPENGQVVFYITNASNRSLTNLQIQYIAYYH